MATKVNKLAILSKTVDCHTEEELMELAKAIRVKFPAGKMSDGVTYWKQSPKDISNKLLKFFEEYDDDYTKEEILAATDAYIKKFEMNVNHSGMRCSKYFILKNLPNGEQTSELDNELCKLRDVESGEDGPVDTFWHNQVI